MMGIFDFLARKTVDSLRAELEAERRKNDIVTLRQKAIDNDVVDSLDIDRKPFSRVYQNNGKWEYEIIIGETVVIHQDCYPGKEGFVEMSEDEAISLSNEIVSRWDGASNGNN